MSNIITEAIEKFFSDRSRSQEETIDGLITARDECVICIEAIRADIQAAEDTE